MPDVAQQSVGEVLESISDAFFALDSQWRFTYLNSAAERLLQRPRQELLGQSVWKEFPQAVETTFHTQYQRAMAERITVEFEEWYPPLGAWFSVRAYPTPAGLSVYFQDVSERRRTQAALREQEQRVAEVAERLSFAMAAAELGDWDWDSATDRMRLSPRAAEIMGVAEKTVWTRTELRRLLPEPDRQRALAAMVQAPSTGGRYNIEYRVNRLDGRQVWVLATGRARYDGQGRLVGMTGILQDITARKEAEERLQEIATEFERQSRLFEQIAATTPDFIYVFDLEGRFLYANRRLLEVWGTTFEQAVGKKLEQLGYPQWHVDMHMRELRQVIETKQPIKGEVPFTGGSGISGIYEYIFTPVLGPDGSVEVIAGTTRDVTDRKRSEREMLEAQAATEASLARWQAVVENMAEGVMLVDAEGNMLDWNRAALEMHGYASIEDVRQPISGFQATFELRTLEGAVVPYEQWPVRRLLQGESFGNFEVRLRRLDSAFERVVSYSGTALRDREGKVQLAVVTLHDLTEERRAQQALRAGEDRFREIFEQTPIGMTLNDLEGRYLHVNPAYCRLVGRSREELLRPETDFRELIHPDDRAHVLDLHQQLLAGKIPAFFLEKRYVRPDGSAVWVRVTGSLRRGPDGTPIQFVRLVEDIDDRKRAEAEAAHLLESERAARSQAEQASRMKDDFLATLSHELRTPLNAILGWSQILARGNSGSEDLAEGLRTIERNARAQTQIIEDLLDMSRIISGKIRLDVQRVDLASIVQAAVETVRPAAQAKGVQIQTVLDPLAAPVGGDPNRLQQVFWNLLSNAVKFTPRGGRVQVLLERVNSHLEVSVSDTGEGVSPEFLPHVFDRFRQADASTTRKHGGLGLGLAIVRQLVELHGGSVSARSAGPGAGATFTIALPVSILHSSPPAAANGRSVPAGAPPETPPACSAQLDGVRVLVVDDEPDARALVQRLLEDCGAVVRAAGSASEALAQLTKEPADVLVSDIGMPGEDGYSLIRRVRSLGPDRGGNTPAVALTAYARAEDRMKAVMSGFQHHVAKPVEPAELITMVASLADPKRAR